MSDQLEQDHQNQVYRANRNKDILNIRRKTRNEQLWKHRLIISSNEDIKQIHHHQSNEAAKRRTEVIILDQSLRTQIERFTHMKISSEMLKTFVEKIHSQDILIQHHGIIGIKRLLVSCVDLPLQTITTPKTFSTLFQFALQPEYPQLQLQSLQIIASLTNTKPQISSKLIDLIIEKGIISLLDFVLSSEHPRIQQIALWCLGNIACDKIEYRNKIINNSFINRIITTLNLTNNQQVVQYGCWALSTLCRGFPLPDYHTIKHAIPLLCCYLESGCITDPETYTDCCWALSNHCEGINGKQTDIINSNLMSKLLPTLQTSQNESLLLAGLRMIGNLAIGNNQITQYLLNLNLLPFLLKSIESTRKIMRREACWVLSNITASEQKHITTVLDYSSLMDKIMNMFRVDDDDIKAEICYIFCNMTHLSLHLDLQKLFRQYGVIECFLELLQSKNCKAVVKGLKTLNLILHMSERRKAELSDRNAILMEIQRLNGIDLLEGLQLNDSNEVYLQVSKILKNYFEIEEVKYIAM